MKPSLKTNVSIGGPFEKQDVIFIKLRFQVPFSLRWRCPRRWENILLRLKQNLHVEWQDEYSLRSLFALAQ